jgi:hypothetical protein
MPLEEAEMTNKERNSKQDRAGKRGTGQNADRHNADRTGDDYRSTNLRDSAMMAHLLDALEQGEDIGEYGRLTFVMVARHFMEEEELVRLLERQPVFDDTSARAMLMQVKERDYNPPKRERILQWMERQEFPICPDAEDPNSCNVYRDLQFPERIYEQIDSYWEEKADDANRSNE